jgi:hypothetical protein
MKIKKEVKHILHLDSLGPGQKSRLIDCETLDLSDVLYGALTIRYTTPVDVTGNLLFKVYSGIDTMVFDTEPFLSAAVNNYPGQEAQYSTEIEQISALPFKYLKVELLNTDPSYPYTDIDVWATLVKFE